METCPEHKWVIQSLARIEQRLLDGSKQMESLHDVCSCNSRAVEDLKHIVTNGLQSDVCHIKDVLKALEGFDWFRKGVQKMRDRLFWSVAKGVCLVFIFLVLFHLTDAATLAIVKGLLK